MWQDATISIKNIIIWDNSNTTVWFRETERKREREIERIYFSFHNDWYMSKFIMITNYRINNIYFWSRNRNFIQFEADIISKLKSYVPLHNDQLMICSNLFLIKRKFCTFTLVNSIYPLEKVYIVFHKIHTKTLSPLLKEWFLSFRINFSVQGGIQIIVFKQRVLLISMSFVLFEILMNIVRESLMLNGI